MRNVGQGKGDYLLFSEGYDNDGDGRVNEDGIGGLDLHRNYPENWRPMTEETGRGYTQGGAGEYPPDHSMGSHTPKSQQGDWYVEDNEPSVLRTDDNRYTRAIGDSPKVCARIALAGHEKPAASRAPRVHRVTAPALTDLADRLSDSFDTRVKVELGRRKGKIVVEFASVDDLERIVELMVPGMGPRPSGLDHDG